MIAHVSIVGCILLLLRLFGIILANEPNLLVIYVFSPAMMIPFLFTLYGNLRTTLLFPIIGEPSSEASWMINCELAKIISYK